MMKTSKLEKLLEDAAKQAAELESSRDALQTRILDELQMEAPDEKALGKMEQQQGDVEQKLVRLATRKGLLEKQLADAAQEQARGDFIERVREADALRDEAAVAGIAFSKALADLQTKGTQAYEAAGKYLKERSRLREAAQAMGLEQPALEDLRALPVDPEIQTVFVEIRRLARTHVILW